MTAMLFKEIAAQVHERDKQEFTLGDTLDVKIGLMLVAMTFLTSQSASILGGPNVSLFITLTQTVSIIALVAGGVFAVAGLWPRDYLTDAPPDQYESWLSQLHQHFEGQAEAESRILEQAIAGRAERAKERIQRNLQLNKRKSWLLMASFRCVVVAFVFNVAAVASRLS